MTRAAAVAVVAFGLALATSMVVERLWPKAHAEPFGLIGAGIVMLAAGAAPREHRAGEAPMARATMAVPPQQQRAG